MAGPTSAWSLPTTARPASLMGAWGMTWEGCRARATASWMRCTPCAMLPDGKDACGVGYINAPASHAFAVVGWRCATGNYSFAHEVGHVLGANHDRANASGSPYPYGHGYQFSLGSGERFRTIMSYDCPGGCTRINSWSNPDITYGGARTGDAATADNQRVLVQRKHVVAGFR